MIEMRFKKILGIDIGGSGIKGAPVHTEKGKLLQSRHRIATPQPATPEAVAGVVKELVDHFNWEGPIGIGFPAVVMQGVVKTASNIDKSWIGTDAQKLFSETTGLPVVVVNDADAAGMAELKFGAGREVSGTVVLITVGTGIGTVLFSNGKLVPNTEFGQTHMKNGLMAEAYTADSVRERENLSWAEFGKRFNEYLHELEEILYPELIIVGGGVSKREEKFKDQITVKTPVVMAEQRNEAGLIGAAIAARSLKKQYK